MQNNLTLEHKSEKEQTSQRNLGGELETWKTSNDCGGSPFESWHLGHEPSF